MKIQIQWTDLGNPTQPGTYMVKGIGEIIVKQEDIDEAARLGGTPQVEIDDVTTFGHSVRQFAIGLFIP
ncbi:MAG: hypothetical protein WCB68_00025 [Pyrinomonadaceae bacterium]